MEKIAVAYYRTSSLTNVDGDSGPRQERACQGYAKSEGITIARPFWDEAVKGSDPVNTRPGFKAMLAFMAEHGIKIILVENVSRFSRDLITQETGYVMLKDQGIIVIPVDDPTCFTDDSPTRTMIRQILGAVSQFEKSNLVLKLASARAAKRATTGRCEGRPQAPEAARHLAKTYREQGLSLRDIAAKLAVAGHTVHRRNKTTNLMEDSGKTYGADSIQRML